MRRAQNQGILTHALRQMNDLRLELAEVYEASLGTRCDMRDRV